MPRKHIFQIGDKIKVVNPLRVERVGYNLTIAGLYDQVAENPELENAAKLLGISINDYRSRNSFIYGIAGALIRDLGFGGRERKIFYSELKYDKIYLQDRILTVSGKRTVKTGLYYPSWSARTYDGDYDYKPGGLENAKTHIILSTTDGVDIEAINVKLII